MVHGAYGLGGGCVLGLVVKLERKWEYNIKTDLRGKNAQDVDCIRLDYESKKCRAVVNKHDVEHSNSIEWDFIC